MTRAGSMVPLSTASVNVTPLAARTSMRFCPFSIRGLEASTPAIECGADTGDRVMIDLRAPVVGDGSGVRVAVPLAATL